MAEYIEREAALNKLCRDNCGHDYNGKCYNCYTAAFIEQYPAADVAPVVHGRWVLRSVSDVTSTFMCSECGREFEVANAYFGTPTNHPDKNYPYCNCGARMDGE